MQHGYVRRVRSGAPLLVICALAAAARGQSPDLVISQVYTGGGGNSSAPNGDFVELFNRGCGTVDLGGWSLQQALGATSNLWFKTDLPAASIPPGRYFLIRLQTTGVGTAYAADFLATGGSFLDPAGGKIALVRNTLQLSAACPGFAPAGIADFFGYGAANCAEGTPRTPTISAASGRSYIRLGGGCTDTNSNLNNFTTQTSGFATPRNSTSPPNLCAAPVPASGACNLPSGQCSTLTASACSAAGGAYAGDCTACAPAGACCLSDGACRIATQAGCGALGGVGWTAGGACALGAAGYPRTYQLTSGLPIPIPDNNTTGISATIFVTDTFVVGDVDVLVGIPQHTFVGDLVVRITHNSVSQDLWVGRCGNFTGLTAEFDDEGPFPSCTSPVAGLIPPSVTGQGPLSIFDGQQAAGAWTLRVFDVIAIDNGALETFAVIIDEALTSCAGSCCIDTNCVTTTSSDCAGLGGVFNGLATTCQTAPCATPEGACCLSGGTCQIAAQAACAQQGGAYIGDFSACSPDPCPRACCLPTGACQDHSANDCVVAGGAAQAGGTSCASQACPVPPGLDCASAIVVGSVPFNVTLNNVNHPANGPPGTCNIGATIMQNAAWLVWTPDVGCSAVVVVDSPSYDAVGAVYEGQCAELAQLACTLDLNPIIMTFCAQAGHTYFIQVGDLGMFAGGGVTSITLECFADANGACCMPNGLCQERSAADCSSAGGVFNGDCSSCATLNCPPAGACCLPAGGCQFITAALCTAQAGGYSGDGVSCFAEEVQVFTSNPFVTIPDDDPQGITDTQMVGASFIIGDVDVSVDISDHTFISDLEIQVEHNAIVRVLWFHNCFAFTFLIAVFDDEGTITICEAPAVGPYPPIVTGDGPLSVFDGQNVHGPWTLTVADTVAADEGTLISWSVLATPEASICPPPAACCFGDASCQSISPPACTASGGAPGVSGSSCSPNPCTPTVRACCFGNGSCQMLLSAACLTAGGAPQGAMATCFPNICTAVCLLGDANCDGRVNNFDIDFFVQAVLSPLAVAAPPAYLAFGGTQACWDQHACWADMDHSGAVNNFDIDPFVECVLSPPPPATPCP